MNKALWLLALLMIGCDPAEEDRRRDDSVKRNHRINEVQRDGHRFLIFTTDYSAHSYSVLHHPDCQCGKGR